MTGTIIFALNLTGSKAETSIDMRNLVDVDYRRLAVLCHLFKNLESSCNTALFPGGSPNSLETETGETYTEAAEEDPSADPVPSNSEFDI